MNEHDKPKEQVPDPQPVPTEPVRDPVRTTIVLSQADDPPSEPTRPPTTAPKHTIVLSAAVPGPEDLDVLKEPDRDQRMSEEE